MSLTFLGCTAAKKTDRGLIPPGAEFRTGLPVEPGYAQQFGYSHRWARSVELAKGQSVTAVKILDDLLVTVEAPDNVVTALNLRDGSLVWKVVIGDKSEQFHGPMGDGRYVYVNSTRRLFKLLRRNGEIVDVYDLPLPVSMTPILVDEIAVFGSINGKLYGFDVDNGFRKWTYALKSRITSSPVLDGETIFAADDDGNYVMLAAKSGQLRWRGAAYGPITADPVLNRFDVVVASEDQSLYSLQANTGSENWPAYRSEVPLTQTPAVIDEVIYLVEPDRGLTAINAKTGQAIWKTKKTFQPVASSQGGVIARSEKALNKIDPATGEVLQTVPTRDIQLMLNGPAGSLIVVTPKGEIMRIDPQP
ncbi:MAG: PQQ-binding-like beta-propeller repeat protein [Planctomycetota bacterium]